MRTAETAMSSAQYGDFAPSLVVRRITAAGIAAGCAMLLAIALLLNPSPDGLGTHQQLNLPSCGWVSLMDIPCMTCGMTTAYSHAVRGSILSAILAQPLGGVLALATAMTMLGSVHVAITGARLEALVGRLWTRRTIWILVLFALASWGFKIVTYKEFLG